MAKNNSNELGLALLEREIFLARNAKEKVGPLRRNLFKHGRPGDNGNEPLHRFKDGNYWFHARFGE